MIEFMKQNANIPRHKKKIPIPKQFMKSRSSFQNKQVALSLNRNWPHVNKEIKCSPLSWPAITFLPYFGVKKPSGRFNIESFLWIQEQKEKNSLKSKSTDWVIDWQSFTLWAGEYPYIAWSFFLSAAPWSSSLSFGSMKMLLDIAISFEGSRRLATWLLQKAPDLTGILKRQQVIRQLVGLTRFRIRLQLNFRLVSGAQLEGKKFFFKNHRR